MTCRRFRALLGRLCDEGLDRGLLDSFCTHLRSCWRCRDFYVGARDMEVLLGAALAPDPGPDQVRDAVRKLSGRADA